MPELMIDFITSLEGHGAADGWPGWWGLEGPEYLAWLGDQPEAAYTVLMGANTYRLMSQLAAEGEPGTEELAGMSKIVFSSTLTEPLAWPNSRLISGEAVDAVRTLKDEGAESMRTLGSLTLCRSLLAAGLVDRFRLVVFPMLKPITVTALVLNAVSVWNDFFTPLLYLSGSDQQTMPVAVAGFVGQFVSDWNLIFAALLISIVPVLAVYLALQRSIINGFAGGLKG